MLNNFFPIVDMCLSYEDMAQEICAMVRRWRFFGEFLGPAFPASRVQHISDLHSKFALGPHHVSKYGRHPTKYIPGFIEISSGVFEPRRLNFRHSHYFGYWLLQQLVLSY